MEPLAILLATDGSAEASTAVDFLQALPLVPGSTVQVLCAVQSLALKEEARSGQALQELVQFERTNCQTAVTAAVQSLARDQLQVLPSVREIPATEAILNAAFEWEVDLIMVGAKGRGRVAALVLGGTTRSVARQTSVPLLAARPIRRGLHTVVVATDGGAPALRAASFLARLPLPASTRILAAHVLPPTEAGPSLLEWGTAESDATLAELRRLQPPGDPPEDRCRVELLVGDPAEEIIRLAEVTDADLVVAGAGRSSWLEKALSGSVADRLLPECPCSVLLVP